MKEELDIDSISTQMFGRIHRIIRGFNKDFYVEMGLKFSQADADRDVAKPGLFDGERIRSAIGRA